MPDDAPGRAEPLARPVRTVTTMRDIAAAAKVSQSTVSRVLSGGKPVSPEVAERVRAAARDVGYRPNPAARGHA